MNGNEALNLLKKYSKNKPWVKHCEAVSQLSTYYGNLFYRTIELDLEFIKSASLLHDIGRYKTHDPILHGIEGYRLLMRLGYPREAYFCASHIFFGLTSREAHQYGLPREPFIPKNFEEQLITITDFLIEFDKATTLNSRFASLRERNCDNEYFLARLDDAERKANKFLKKTNDQFGVCMEKIACSILV
jgi:uncharacterized protein